MLSEASGGLFMHICDNQAMQNFPEETEDDKYRMFSVSEEEVVADWNRFSGLGLPADEAWKAIISSCSLKKILEGRSSVRYH